ncbi:MAG: phosphotransferase [Mycobacteriales bacterium]
MHDRSILGAADVSDAELTDMVARLLDEDASSVTLIDSSAAVAPYDLDALTTLGRYRVRGRAVTPSGARPFSFFVKVVQSWSRTPMFEFVPPEFREQALASIPWRIEPLIYQSDLGDRLPEGLKMATAFAVFDIDEASGAIWMRDIDAVSGAWDVERFRRAAYLLGRLAASDAVRHHAGIGRADQHIVREYVYGRVAGQLVPAINSDIWEHPLVATTFGDSLRARLIPHADDVQRIVDELETMPVATFHGDACSRNLLVERDSIDLVLIDFGFWGRGPIGFDLAQLLIGEIQTGERDAAQLPELERACLPAYVEGLRAEGCEVPIEIVERSHALQMLVFAGLSALPLEQLDMAPTPELERVARGRAEGLRFMLDLVDATAKVSAA